MKRINVEEGDIFHALKASEKSFSSFGEAYFSTVRNGAIKAWKRHREMTLNIIVPVGNITFVLIDDHSPDDWTEITLGESNYQRLTVPPGWWTGFTTKHEGLNLLLNIADLEHSPDEVDRKAKDGFSYRWNV